MKETLNFARQHIREAVDVARIQWKSFVASFAVVALIYAASIYLPAGWPSWFATAPAALLITVIALVRLNAIGPECMGLVWQIRRIGMIVLGVAAVTMLAAPFMETPLYPTWRTSILINGAGIVLLTTPQQKPFWKYWTGAWREDETPRSPLTRLLYWLEGHGDMK